MEKMKARKQSAKATLADVMKEMAKPRVVRSARVASRVFGSKALVVENDVEKRTVNP
jgi:hypothetical protein